MYRILRALVCIAVVVGSALVGVSSAYAATLAVCTSGPPVCGFTHIQDAVNAAHPGDTIVILPGTYNENLVVGPSAATPLMLVGQGATVNGGGVGSVLTVVAAHTVTVNGLTLTNGKALATSGFNGGGVANLGGTVTFNNSRIAENTATEPSGNLGRGGGILNGGTMTLNNTTVSGNTAERGGGIFSGSQQGPTTLTLNNSPVTGNNATVGVGGLSNAGVATLTNSAISGNTGGLVGGLGNGDASQATLTNSPVSNNHATATVIPVAAGAFGIAGGIGAAAGTTVKLLNSGVSGNTTTGVSGSAGGINADTGSAVQRTNSPVTGNTPPQCLGVVC